jgi:integrase
MLRYTYRLTMEDVERVLAAYDDPTPQHFRDHAILLLLARLGLRAHEIVTLHLEDIDWYAAMAMAMPGRSVPNRRGLGERLARPQNARRSRSPPQYGAWISDVSSRVRFGRNTHPQAPRIPSFSPDTGSP